MQYVDYMWEGHFIQNANRPTCIARTSASLAPFLPPLHAPECKIGTKREERGQTVLLDISVSGISLFNHTHRHTSSPGLRIETRSEDGAHAGYYCQSIYIHPLS